MVPQINFPLLLVELGGHGGVLRLDGVQAFAQSFDLALEGLVRFQNDTRSSYCRHTDTAGRAATGTRPTGHYWRRYTKGAY